MKLFIGLLVGVIVLLSLTCEAQTTVTKYIKWDPNPEADSVQYYEVYFEKLPNNSGFTIVDGMEYATALNPLFQENVPHVIGQTGKYVYPIDIDITDGGWAVAGVIAFNDIRSSVGASGGKHIKKKPGKPGGVIIDDNP